MTKLLASIGMLAIAGTLLHSQVTPDFSGVYYPFTPGRGGEDADIVDRTVRAVRTVLGVLRLVQSPTRPEGEPEWVAMSDREHVAAYAADFRVVSGD